MNQQLKALLLGKAKMFCTNNPSLIYWYIAVYRLLSNHDWLCHFDTVHIYVARWQKVIKVEIQCPSNHVRKYYSVLLRKIIELLSQWCFWLALADIWILIANWPHVYLHSRCFCLAYVYTYHYFVVHACSKCR